VKDDHGRRGQDERGNRGAPAVEKSLQHGAE
jgi:hypothetical protein